MFLVTGCTFGHFLTDTSAVRISNQDSVGVWDSTMIFVVQKKVSSTYHWKKMYMWQLRHILNDSLKLTNLMIPRLAGTPTSKISLLTFATNTLYRADFNYNFRKIDSLTTEFDLNDFTLTGDTVSIKNKITKDSVYKFVANLVTSDSLSTHSWVKSYVDTVTAASKPSSAYGGLYNDYDSSHLYLGINGSTYRTLKGMTVYNNHNLTLTDSSITIQKAGSYLLTISATAEDTLTTGGASIFAGLFRNGTRIPVASTLLTTAVNSHRINFCITSNLILQANDVLLLKFQGTTPADQLVVWNINYSVYKL